ncbi:MAG: IS1182 family transposase [Candidatus Promineifilaceae bacterium]
MSLAPRTHEPIPDETVRVARAAFPKGNIYLRLRDELGPIFADAQFADLFAWRGQPGESPSQLILVSIMQYLEKLTDRDAADMVRSRIDWKYLLGLPLEDSGFDFSVLSEFRTRLIEGSAERQLLDTFLRVIQERGLVKRGGQQRTDSTHVLAAVRQMNRIELLTECLRRALDAVAAVAPDWLASWVTVAWYERYGRRSEAYRLPHKEKEQAIWLKQVGADGYTLLDQLWQQDTETAWRQLPAIDALRRIWVQQYYRNEEQIHLRQEKQDGIPPHERLIVSPDDLDARYRTKRETHWQGYVVHLTESCDVDSPHLITDVQTTPATVGDAPVLPDIQQNLSERDLLPAEHLVDTAYVSAPHLVNSQTKGIDLIGPVPADNSWQNRTPDAFTVACFSLDWVAQVATCPLGHTSQSWKHRHPGQDKAYLEITFPRALCQECSVRQQCTRSAKGSRVLHLQPQARFDMLLTARQRQKEAPFKRLYQRRAGIEGTLSQGVRSMDLRHSRYIGLAKTHLQHVFTGLAINFQRLYAWFEGVPLARTRVSHFAALAPTT